MVAIYNRTILHDKISGYRDKDTVEFAVQTGSCYLLRKTVKYLLKKRRSRLYPQKIYIKRSFISTIFLRRQVVV